MKRCPQCEFIYEDDQSLCDMDGFLLVFDAQVLPKPKTPRKVSVTPQWRSRVVPAMAALVLAIVLYLVYFVSTNQQPASRAYPPTVVTSTQPVSNTSKAASDAPANNAQPAANAIETKVPVSAPAPAPTPAAATTKDNKVKSVPVGGTKEAKESNEKPKAKSTQKTQSANQAQKSDSKIGSLLKKTGRILKKPFKI